MKTMNFFKVAMMSMVAMVMTINAANAASINESSTTSVVEANEECSVNKSTNGTVDARSTDWYTQTFHRGESVYIYVKGDGDTDLDLYVYDENGNLVISDTDLGDTCLCTFTPRWTGWFTIKVKNLGGVYNRYHIWFLQ